MFHAKFEAITVSGSKDIEHRPKKKTNLLELYLPIKLSIMEFDQIPPYGGHKFGYQAVFNKE